MIFDREGPAPQFRMQKLKSGDAFIEEIVVAIESAHEARFVAKPQLFCDGDGLVSALGHLLGESRKSIVQEGVLVRRTMG